MLDDELPGLAYLRMMCEQIVGLEVVRAFNDPARLLEESAGLDFDFCILDIEMPGLNGLQLARLLGKKPVIFTTAYKEYAAEAFDLDAIDYIRKPIQKERLEKAVEKAKARFEGSGSGKKFVTLNTNKGKSLLFFDQVLHITNSPIDKRDKLVHLDSGEELVLKHISFEQLLALLPENEFSRISKKDIIALRAVKFYLHNEITLAGAGGPVALPLSENFKKAFIEKTSR